MKIEAQPEDAATSELTFEVRVELRPAQDVVKTFPPLFGSRRSISLVDPVGDNACHEAVSMNSSIALQNACTLFHLDLTVRCAGLLS